MKSKKMIKKLFIFSLIGVLLLGGTQLGNAQENLPQTDIDLAVIAQDYPETTVSLILDLTSDNEQLLNDVLAYRREASTPIDKITENFKANFNDLKKELARRGYDEETLYSLLQSQDEEFMRIYKALEKKYDLTEKDRIRAQKGITREKITINEHIAEMLRDHYKAGQEEVIAELEQFPGTIIRYQDLSTNKLIIDTPAQHIPEIQELVGVHEIVPGWLEDIDELDISVPTTGATTWHNAGHFGSAFNVLSINSNGIHVNHPALDHISFFSQCFFVPNTNCSVENPTADHDSLVAGIIGSDDSTFLGMAKDMGFFFNAQTSGFGQAVQAFDWAVINGTGPNGIYKAEHVTMSKAFGGSTSPVCGNTVQEKYVDESLDLFDVNWIKSAGNNGNKQDKLVTLPAGAYNIIAVGASDPKNTIDRNDDNIASFSSRGPAYLTDKAGNCDLSETRIKPELAAPGMSITSTNSNGGYSTSSGTSFAAPHVTGAVLLLESYPGVLSALESRAWLYNTAEDRDEQTGSTGNDGPDNTWGYGYMDLDKAFADVGKTDNLSMVENEVAYFTSGPFDVGDKVTLVWNRHIVANNGYVNDLNLYLYNDILSDALLESSSVSQGRTIEQVIASDALAQPIVKIKSNGPFEGVTVETAAFASSKQLTKIAAPKITTTFDVTPEFPGCNMSVDLVATIENTGGASIFDVFADVSIPAGYLDLESINNSFDIGVLGPGETHDLTFTGHVADKGQREFVVDLEGSGYGEIFDTIDEVIIDVGAQEMCSDGIDNDCDGLIDETQCL